ncbi:methyltransferase family protein [Rhodovulum sp. DZ06]|uniref:methyltransferase family protein n=1 Tax=Rhodovulum sp. DZ06 TaxID=3425126 RepID=UPI003D341FAA
MRRLEIPPLWMLAAGAVEAALARVSPGLRYEADTLLVIAPALLGFGLILWAALHFRARDTTVHPRARPTALVASGPYRLNRNPMYTGMALILLGWALHLGALTALVPPFIFIAVIDRRFVRDEEAGLRAAFGAEAEAFLSRTRRW